MRTMLGRNGPTRPCKDFYEFVCQHIREPASGGLEQVGECYAEKQRGRRSVELFLGKISGLKQS